METLPKIHDEAFSQKQLTAHRCIQNTVKRLGWGILRKELMNNR